MKGRHIFLHILGGLAFFLQNLVHTFGFAFSHNPNKVHFSGRYGVLCHLERGISDQDRNRIVFAGSFETRGHVDGIPHGSVIKAAVGAHVSHDRRPGIETDTHQ